MGKYPVYRMIDGQVMCQEQSGGRWTPVDRRTVETMLRAFDGVAINDLRELGRPGFNPGLSNI
jgi:hypothetical protein